MERRKTALLFALKALSAAACAALVAMPAGCEDTCEESALRLEECLGESEEGELYQGSETECSGEQECAAACTVEASCGDIGNYFCKLTERLKDLPPSADSACDADDVPEQDETAPEVVNPYEACILSCEAAE